ncbi:MAG: hypothetical protein PWQ76_1102 [Clostridiales bacterium]|jgi:hypothetical protein|nr:hypothetical protein [Oscillospiraceae bacterium]MDN5378847.1 hypothetical protein [Clostridiales bacterium]
MFLAIKRLFVNRWGKSEKMKENRWQSDCHLFDFEILNCHTLNRICYILFFDSIVLMGFK